MRIGKYGMAFLGLAMLACFVLLFYRASVLNLPNSDAHWVPVIVTNFTPGPAERIYIPEHTQALKMPFFVLLFGTFGYDLTTFHISNVANEIAWLAACLLIIVYFSRRDGSAPFRIALFASTVTTSRMFFVETGMSANRNSEYGLAYLLFLACARYLARNNGPARWKTLALIGGGGFLLTLSDELFLPAFLLPVLGLILITSIRRDKGGMNLEISRNAALLGGVASLGATMATLILRIMLRIDNAPIVVTANADFRLNTFEGTLASIGITLKGVIDYLGGDVWGKAPSLNILLMLATVSLGLAALALAARFLIRTIATSDASSELDEHDLSRRHFLFLVSSSLALTLAAYIATSLSESAATLRYISATPIVAALFASVSLEGVRQNRMWKSVFVISAVLFTANTLRLSTAMESDPPGQAYIKDLNQIIVDNQLVVGYAGYWNAYSTAGLTAAADKIIPVAACQPWRYVGVASLFERKPDFLIVDRKGIDKPSWENCTDEQLAALYGLARKTYLLKRGADTVEIRVLK